MQHISEYSSYDTTQSSTVGLKEKFHKVCISGDIETAKSLLNNTENLNDLIWPNGATLVLTAAEGYYDIVELLLSTNHFKNHAKQSALFEAVKNENCPLELIKLLLNSITLDSISSPSFYYHTAISKKRYDLVEMFIRDGRLDPSYAGNKLFKDACQNRDYKLLKLLLLSDKIDPSIDNMRYVTRANDTDNEELIDILINDERVVKNLYKLKDVDLTKGYLGDAIKDKFVLDNIDELRQILSFLSA